MFKVNGKDDFYPTPREVVEKMIFGEDLEGKVILEPSAGKGDLINVIREQAPKEILGCEINEDLRLILKDKCNLIGTDFLKVRKEDISHVEYIIMNPPFSADEKHILHAWDIAPAGCKIIALCNIESVRHYSFLGSADRRTKAQHQLQGIIKHNGDFKDLGECFTSAERKTNVSVAMVHLTKCGQTYEQEFSGFFMEEEADITGGDGIVSYNWVRDLVSRYISSVKLYDKQLEIGVEMEELTNMFFERGSYKDSSGQEKLISFCTTYQNKEQKRLEFKKSLQGISWRYIFNKMDMDKYTTAGLESDLNKFIETQTNIPFTMKNIYKMIEIVVGTTAQRMDRALVEVFDKLTEHHHDNRYCVEGWKTNSHFLVNKRFIFPCGASANKTYRTDKYGNYKDVNDGTVNLHSGELQTLKDLEKALCFMEGIDYNSIHGIGGRNLEKGQWYNSHYFTFRGYIKGTVHCEFKDEDVWGRFNQKVAQLKGFPLYEYKSTKDTKKHDEETAKRYRPEEDIITEDGGNQILLQLTA